jgi:HAD superfamily hydrolase (TIGR01509 family)
MRPIVFDCDGVLVDSEVLSWRAWRRVLGRYAVDVDDSEVAALTGRTVDVCHAHFAARAEIPALGGFMDELGLVMSRELEAHLEAFDDAAYTLDALRGRVPMAVASSSYRDRLDLSLRTTGLAGSFEASVAGDEVAEGKPSPDLFVEAARRLGVEPGACVAVEDTPAGIESAVAAGMWVVAVDRGLFTPDQLRAAGADVLVPRLTPAVLMVD